MAGEHWSDEGWGEGVDENCPRCEGDGVIHCCGEDTCCCLDPWTQDLIPCPDCGGSGRA